MLPVCTSDFFLIGCRPAKMKEGGSSMRRRATPMNSTLCRTARRYRGLLSISVSRSKWNVPKALSARNTVNFGKLTAAEIFFAISEDFTAWFYGWDTNRRYPPHFMAEPNGYVRAAGNADLHKQSAHKINFNNDSCSLTLSILSFP